MIIVFDLNYHVTKTNKQLLGCEQNRMSIRIAYFVLSYIIILLFSKEKKNIYKIKCQKTNCMLKTMYTIILNE